MDHQLDSLLLVTLLAFTVPLVIARVRVVRIPIVVGEIAAGVLVGPSGLGLITSEPWLEFLTEFGLAYLLFLAGLEMNFDILIPPRDGRLRDLALSPLALGTSVFLFALALGLAATTGLAMAGLIESPYLVALIMSATSLGIVVPVLREKGIAGTPFGQTLLVSTLVSDFAAMFLLAVLVALISGGLSLDLLLILVLFAAVFVLYRLGLFLKGWHVLKDLAPTAQIKVRGAFALMVVLVSLAAQLGVEVILGAFLAGTIVSLISRRGSDLVLKMDAIGFGFFVPIFFIMTGAHLDFSALTERPEALLLAPILVLIAFAIKVLPAMVLRMAFTWREAMAGGVLLSSQLSVTIAAAAIGLAIGAIDRATHAALILVAVITSSISPVVFHRLIPTRHGQRREAILLVGATRTAGLLAQRLSRQGLGVTVLDRDCGKLAEIEAGVAHIVCGDGTVLEDLERAGVREAGTIIGLTGDDDVNIESCRAARGFGVENRLAIIRNPAGVEKARELGVRAVTPELSTLAVLENLARHPSSFSLLAEETDLHIEEILVLNAACHRRRLREIPLPGDGLIIAVNRGEERLVPHGDTELRLGDVVTVVGNESDLDGLRTAFAAGR